MHSISALLVSFLLLLGPIADGWLGVYLDAEREEAVVTEPIPGSPAAKAGVKAGDVILAVGDQATPSREKLIAVIGAASPGDRVSLKVRREGREMTLEVKLGTRPETAAIPPIGGRTGPTKEAPPAPEQESAPRPATDRAFLGVGLVDTVDGLQIERVLPDSPAASAGVAVGDFLQSFGDQTVGKAEDIHRLLEKAKPGSKVAVGLKGREGVRSVLITLGSRPADQEVADGHGEPPPPPMPPQVLVPRRAGKRTVESPKNLDAELEALREELRELRKQVEELRRQNRRE